jgi:hypothetical protein
MYMYTLFKKKYFIAKESHHLSFQQVVIFLLMEGRATYTSQYAEHTAWSRWQAVLGLLFNPEDGGDVSLRKIGRLLTDYTTFYRGR